MDRPTPAERAFMLEALRLAARPARRPWPNPPVGAVVVRGKEVVGRGAHHGAGTPHAEALALAEAGDRARGSTLYCTLEPCNHRGRTPPCAPAIVAAGVTRLVVAMRDPNPRVSGGGIEAARRAGLDVSVGLCAGEALDLAWPFVVTAAFDRPFVWLKTAASRDGFFAPAAMAPGTGPVYLTGEEARRDVHVLRRWADVVLVGARTAAADRPRLDGRLAGEDAPCPPEDPIPAVASTRLPDSTPWEGRAHLAFVGPSAPASAVRTVAAAGGTVVACAEGASGVEPSSVLDGVRRLGKHCLLVEGGPTLAAAFLRAGLVDRWLQYTAPEPLGSGVGWPGESETSTDRGHGGPCPLDLGFTLTRTRACGRDRLDVWDRAPFEDACAALAAGPAPGRPKGGA